MINRIEQSSVTDIPYADYEVNRDSGALNGDFMHLDGGGPLRLGIDIARAHGRLAVLDAGCGSGYGVIDFKDQVSFRAPVTESEIVAHGIGLSDVRSQFNGGWEEKERLQNGYFVFTLGNLATAQLKPNFYDVAFSYQVLLHNSHVEPIVRNVMTSLSENGAYYFDTLPAQQSELNGLLESLDPNDWEIVSKPLTRQFFGGEATRMMTKLTRL